MISLTYMILTIVTILIGLYYVFKMNKSEVLPKARRRHAHPPKNLK